MELKHSLWKEILNNNKKYTFFSSKEWYDILSDYYNRPYKILQLEEKVILPVFTKKKGPFTIYTSSPPGTYSGLIKYEKPYVNSKYLIREYFHGKNYDLVGCPFSNQLNCEDYHDFTQVVMLPTFNDGQLSKNHLRSIKRAKKKNLVVETSNRLEDWKAYYNIYEGVTKERGIYASNAYGWNLFRLIHSLNEDKRKLYLIKNEGQIHGGAIIFYQNIVSYWHGANDSISKLYGGSHLLHYEIIKSSKRNSFKIYDLNPSGGHAGVVRFKKGFGSNKIFYNVFENRNMLFKSVSKIYRVIKG